MNNREKVKQICGVTEFAYFDRKNPTEINCLPYYKNYAEEMIMFYNKQSISVYKNREFIFDYSSRFNINGKAHIDKEIDLVFISEGSLYKIYSAFSRLVIDGAFSEFTYIKEIVNIQIKQQYEDVIEYQYDYSLPIDYNGKLISEYMSMFAVKFIILHELAHHINGHLLYIQEYYGQDHFQNNQLPKNLIKTLEMDADAFAISQLVLDFKEIVQNDIELNNLLIPNEIKLGLLIFSLTTLLIMLEEENIKTSNKYMSGKMRRVHNLSCLETNLKIRYPDFFDGINYDSVAAYYLDKSERYYKLVYDYSDKIVDSIYQIKEEYKSFHDIKNMWNDIHNELSKFARASLSPKY
ncbi:MULTISPECIES: hypothetical protein [unclassified Exiguobacterium]|uniref:hypothetical protein n=1 Tax=unclassified Exiguobacterium TaxID=2644629 RepID=UPI001BE52D4A|nr:MULTISPECIES: hypothetical protein [unclassified Exiguobacterium]